MRSQYRGRVDKRQAIGSWLSGPRAAAEEMGIDLGYRGQRLGLPKDGPGSIAPAGRRIVAILIDWALCLLISYAFLADRDQIKTGNWAPLVFFVLSLCMVGTIGSTPGKLVMRLRVIGEGGDRLSLPRVLLRSVLLIVVIPAAIWDRDGRGMHDRFSRALQVRI